MATAEAEKLADRAKPERDNAAACAKPRSFPPGTRVLLTDGATLAIEDTPIGDRIAAGDPQVGLTAARLVTNTFTTEGDKDFTQITVATEQGTATITATDDHPFWLADDQRRRNAGDLRARDAHRTSPPTTCTRTIESKVIVFR
ncbi:Hint domain-containing protein [Saccharothrix saharensis]|uniref:Hint domain-containing protein n=1 Tax=Saccharothrix saharensis TaxID=571190 RepID=UPI0036911382